MNYSSNDQATGRVLSRLRSMSDSNITAMCEHVRTQHFHPDTEFSTFRTECKLSDDEFVEMLLSEEEVRKYARRDPAI